MCQFIHIKYDPKYFSDIILIILVPLKEGFLRMPGGSWAQKMPLFTRWLELQLVVDNTRMFSSLQLCMSRKPGVSVCVCVCTHALYKNVYRCVCAWVHMLGLVPGMCQQNPNSLYCFYVEKTTSPWIHSLQLYDIMKNLILYFKKTHILKRWRYF